MDETQQATIRKTEADTDAVYIQAGVLDPSEVRQRLANNPDSPYDGLDPDDIPEAPDMGMMPGEGQKTDEEDEEKGVNHFASDSSEWDEGKHPRAENGQFGSGAKGNARKKSKGAKQALPEIKGNELGVWHSLKELRNKAKEYAQRFVGKKFTNQATGNEITVGMNGVKHTIFGAQEELIKTVPGIPAIIQTAKFMRDEGSS